MRKLFWILRFLHHQGAWKFNFYSAQHKRDHGNAITILQLNIHGVQAAMIMTEIYVERNDHGSRGSSVASFSSSSSDDHDLATRPRPRPSGHGHGHPATDTATRPATAIRPRPSGHGHGHARKKSSSLQTQEGFPVIPRVTHTQRFFFD